MTTQSREQAERQEHSPEDIRYPESDGEPIGETDFHISNILYLRQALRQVFRKPDDPYVAANMLFYYEQGNAAACRAPDVFVVPGVAKRDRRTFKVWEEGRVPGLVIEVTSKTSQVEDLWIKRRLYEKLGVTEYLLFDPLEEYLNPRFQAFVLEVGQYSPVSVGAGEGYRSRQFGIELRPMQDMLRVMDPKSGEPVPLLDEALDRLNAEAQRADAEAQRADSETQRADSETQRADSETQRADAEAQRARALEEEVRSYRERLGPK